MPRIVSGFKKTKRHNASIFFVLAYAWRGIRSILTYEVATLPRWRKPKASPRPQTYLKRDIHQKRLGNPFRGESWTANIWQNVVVANRFGIAFACLIFVSSFWGIVVFAQPTFYIDRVSIRGTSEINPDEIRSIVDEHLGTRSWLFVRRSHRLFMSLDDLRTTIMAKYDLETLRFSPDWTAHTLEIEVHEKPSLFVYGVANRYFALDKDGRVIRELADGGQDFPIPVVYEYDSARAPTVGDSVLNRNVIASIQRLHDGLQGFPEIQIHSFRLRISPQREITITDRPPQTESDKAAESQEHDTLKEAAETIAQAKTVEQKIEELKRALSTIDVEKLEEGKLDQLLREQRVYSPTEGFAYQELEIYTKQGWSIKIGHSVFEDATAADYALNIFATLKQGGTLGEVREYIDLRIPNRVYYR